MLIKYIFIYIKILRILYLNIVIRCYLKYKFEMKRYKNNNFNIYFFLKEKNLFIILIFNFND